MAKEEPAEEVKEEQPVKKKPFLKLIVIALVLLALGGGIFAALYFFNPFSGGKKQAVAPRPAMGALWAIDPFIVNLADNQGERYLKVVMQLEVSDQILLPELEQLKPRLRDNILDLLTAKSYGEIMEMGGKQRLREEIVTRLNSYLSKGKILRVYFSEFVVQ